MGGFVGQNGVDIPVAQARLVQAQVTACVVGIQRVFIRVVMLIPAAVITYALLVLLAERLALKAVSAGKRADAYGGILNLPLLKKPRTQH